MRHPINTALWFDARTMNLTVGTLAGAARDQRLVVITPTT
jgi:hypothetical protein